MRRLLATLTLAAAALMLGAGAAHAATPPVPDNPLANAGYSAFSPAPVPLPNPNDAFDPNDLLSHYGTAGPTWHYYDLNPLEEVGASLWVEVTNDAMGLPKLAISAVASLATWVFNPASFLDQLKGPADDSARALYDNLAAPWLPVLLLVVAIAIAWGARTGRLGMAFTRVLFTLIGLALVGLAVASPSSIAAMGSGLVTDTVSSVLLPAASDDTVKSDSDAQAAAQAKANIGTKMLGPLWRVAVYDPWVSGTFGSPTSKTAQDNAPDLFKAQAWTWNEAATVDGKKEETNALVKQSQDDWTATATKVNEADPVAYRYLQGSNPSLAPVLVSYVVTAAVLPFVTVALLMVLAGYLVLFILAALLPVIGLAVIVAPGVLGKTGRFLVGILVNTVVMAAASVVILKLTNALLCTGNVLFSVVLVGMASYVAWRFLKGFRGFKPVTAAAATATSTAAAASTAESVKKTTKSVTKSATKKATKTRGGVKADAGAAPAGVSEGDTPAAAKPAGRPDGAPAPAAYVPVRKGEPAQAEPDDEPLRPLPRPAPWSAANGDTLGTPGYVPAAAATEVDPDATLSPDPVEPPAAATRHTPGTARAAYVPARVRFEDEEIPA